MISTDIYMKYVVYITTYTGDLLPPNYIGSSYINKIECGYFGTVKSKKYKYIWDKELKEHPELFNLEIISYHNTRSEALCKELYIQRMFNVVKSPLFINMAYAQPNGFYGRDVSKENNPMFGKNRIDIHWSKKISKEDLKIKYDNIDRSKSIEFNKSSKPALGHKKTDELKLHYSKVNKLLRWFKNEKTKECIFSRHCPKGFVPGRYINKINN